MGGPRSSWPRTIPMAGRGTSTVYWFEGCHSNVPTAARPYSVDSTSNLSVEHRRIVLVGLAPVTGELPALLVRYLGLRLRGSVTVVCVVYLLLRRACRLLRVGAIRTHRTRMMYRARRLQYRPPARKSSLPCLPRLLILRLSLVCHGNWVNYRVVCTVVQTSTPSLHHLSGTPRRRPGPKPRRRRPPSIRSVKELLRPGRPSINEPKRHKAARI